jgi:hypothetical protein
MSHWIMKLLLLSAIFHFNFAIYRQTTGYLLCCQTSWIHIHFPKFNNLIGMCWLRLNNCLLVTNGAKEASCLLVRHILRPH